MNKQLTYLLFIFSCVVLSQETTTTTSSTRFILTPEVMAGAMPESNSNFPSRKFQKQILLSIGWDHDRNMQEWAQRLKGPRTGISFGYTDFGNSDELGSALSIMPFIEFKAFKKENLKVHVGMGASYFNKKYDAISNINNQAISTDVTWSFRVFSYYELFQVEKIDLRIGGGYFHHSNGHSKLPNSGYNSFLLSVSADIKNKIDPKNGSDPIAKELSNRSYYNYFSLRSGFGENVFSLAFNDRQSIYTLSGEYGRVFNNTFKIGVGFYYRYYQIYYNYIANNEFLVRDGNEFDHYKKNPFWNASNLGISISGEVLLNHFGINVQLGINLHKPGYKIDWRINQGWDNAPIELWDGWIFGEFDTKYKLKKTIASRLGLKYYLIGTKNAPKHNIFIGMDLNANGGQADFTEVSLGYVYSFNFSAK